MAERHPNRTSSLTLPPGLFHAELTMPELARKRAGLHPERIYVTFLADGEREEHHLSYGELDRAALSVAGWLQQQGLHKGDRAMMMLPNGLEFVQILFGCFYAGVIAVPQPQQLQAYLKTFLPTMASAKPKLLVATDGIVSFIRHNCPEHLKPVFSQLKVVSAAELLSRIPQEFSPPRINRADIAYLQYTSGSTGTPKGVMISHRNILANMEQARIFGNWEEGKGTSLWLPLFHDFGLAAGLLGAMVNGGFVILMTPAHFMVKPLRWLSAISRYRCAYSYAPPFGYDLCVRRITAAEKTGLDLSSLVSSVYGAEPVHYESVRRFNDCFAACGLSKTAVRPGFGMAETVIMFSESDRLRGLMVDREELERHGRLRVADNPQRPGRVKALVDLGPAMHGHEIVIRGEGNIALPQGQVGEIMLSGPSVCEGYFENPTATRSTFQQTIAGKNTPFLATGDLGLLWKGHLYFTGRIKDVIIVRGRNYFPQDIEHAVPLGPEIRPDCVMAFSNATGTRADRLVIAMELDGSLLRDRETLFKYVVPAVDNRVVAEIGKQLQIHPDVRLYLKPGSLVKTSSGKIKHLENRANLLKDDFPGLIIRMPDSASPDNPDDVETVVRLLFKRLTGLHPDIDSRISQLNIDRSTLADFLEKLEELYSVPEGGLTDWADDDGRLEDLIGRLEDHLLSGSIPM